MKKSLLALALLGAFGAASAQSSVTLYGVADVNLQRTDPKAGTTTDLPTTTGVSSGYQAGSRLGVRGTEALGGGLNAIFSLEMGYATDDGTRGQASLPTGVGASTTVNVDRLFGRQAWAGLSGGFGSVVAGRLAAFSSGTGSFDMFGQVDPFETAWGNASIGLTFSSGNNLRVDNAIAYVSPTMGGFKGGIGYSFNASGPEVAGSGNNAKALVTGLSFGAGPFYGVVTYDTIDIPNVSDKQTHLQVGGTFDLKFVKFHAAFAQEEALQVLNSGANAGGDADAWMVGATVPFGATQLRTSYQKRDVDATATAAEGERKVWAIGVRHALSNRTFLALGYSDLTRDGSQKTTNNGGAKQLTLGVRHNF